MHSDHEKDQKDKEYLSRLVLTEFTDAFLTDFMQKFNNPITYFQFSKKYISQPKIWDRKIKTWKNTKISIMAYLSNLRNPKSVPLM